MILGAHEATAGGYYKAVDRAKKDRAKALQIFCKSPRRWDAKPIEAEVASRFREALGASRIESCMVHDSYLINLGDPDNTARRRSVAAFVDELQRTAVLGVPHLVFHPGAHKGDGEKRCLVRIAKSLDRALEEAGEGVDLLLENTAGQGSSVGHSFEQLATIIGHCKRPDRLGICLDTAHALAAGYDLQTEEGYEQVFEQLDRTIGLDRLRAFHLNDSKKDRGTRVDRHEQIGKGFLGLEFFRRLVNDPRFKDLPGCLETPSLPNGNDSFARNLRVLRKLIDERKLSR